MKWYFIAGLLLAYGWRNTSWQFCQGRRLTFWIMMFLIVVGWPLILLTILARWLFSD